MDYSVRAAQADSSPKLVPAETSPAPRAVRRQFSSPEDVPRCQCKLRELCRLATASRPDKCARTGELASKVNPTQGSDNRRLIDRIEIVQVWQPAAILEYASISDPDEPAPGDGHVRMRARGKKCIVAPCLLRGARCSVWGCIEGGQASASVCRRTDVSVPLRPPSRPAMGAQVHLQVSEK